jgi:hypothetical protein
MQNGGRYLVAIAHFYILVRSAQLTRCNAWNRAFPSCFGRLHAYHQP